MSQLNYQISYASLSAPNEKCIAHFRMLELLRMQPKTLPQVWKFHPVTQLPSYSSHSELHSAGLH